MRRNHKYLKTLFQKNLAVCLCFLILFGTVSVEAEETESIEKGYSYRLIETVGGEKYAAVTAYMGNETSLVVPEKLGGCPVREVNLNSLNMVDSARYEKIRSIVFPNTIVNLKNITIPASVTNIYGRISDNETLQYRVQNGSYADEYLTRSEKNVVQIGKKVSVNDLQIEGKKDCSKTLKFISPSESRTVCLEAEIFPINASNRRLEWKVDGTDVISFDDGMGLNNHGSKFYFDVKKGGTAKITAVSEDGSYTAVCTVYAVVSLACPKIALANDIFMYDGKEKRPRVMIDGLTEGKDYTVAYKNNISAGTGTVTITGIGSNTGQVVKQFFYKIRSSYRIVGGAKSYSSFTRTKKITIKK